MLDLCHAINTAIAEGKIVTLDTQGFSTQVGGAIPGFCLQREVHCILHRLNGLKRNVVKIMSVKGHYVRAYYPHSDNVDILYDPALDKDSK